MGNHQVTFEIRTKFIQLPAETFEFFFSRMRFKVTIESIFQLETLTANLATVVTLVRMHVSRMILERRERLKTGSALITNELAIVSVQIDVTAQAGAQHSLEITQRTLELPIFAGVRTQNVTRQSVLASEYFLTTIALEQRMIIQTIFTLMRGCLQMTFVISVLVECFLA